MTFVLPATRNAGGRAHLIGAGMLTALKVFAIHRNGDLAHSSRRFILSQG
jgi:hypothetical protein